MKKALIALVLATASNAAHADALLYASVGAGQATYDIGDGVSEKETGYSLTGGTGLLPFIGIEAGTVNHGTMSFSGSSGAVDVTASSYFAAVRPSIDFVNLHIYGKAGIHSTSTETKVQSNNMDTSNIGLLYGVGAEYFFMPMFSTGLSYTIFNGQKVNDGAGERSYDLNNLSLNVTFHFL
ncbi:porin family protein [Vibrio makurazakiensis]|uniref:outer membrane beta-barrel protein n=1 Tax=Vibrio makurazakiensis TaxID=2910250 RepID=UPI003D128300